MKDFLFLWFPPRRASIEVSSSLVARNSFLTLVDAVSQGYAEDIAVESALPPFDGGLADPALEDYAVPHPDAAAEGVAEQLQQEEEEDIAVVKAREGKSAFVYLFRRALR